MSIDRVYLNYDPDEVKSGSVIPSLLENVTLKEYIQARRGYATWRIGKGECEPWPDGIVLRRVRVTGFDFENGSIDITWESEAPFEEHQGED